MLGLALVGVLSILAYAAGVPLLPLLAAIIIGTWIEYRWIRKRNENTPGS